MEFDSFMNEIDFLV